MSARMYGIVLLMVAPDCRSVRRIILIWSDEMVLPPFSTADRISARYEMGDGCDLAKT